VLHENGALFDDIHGRSYHPRTACGLYYICTACIEAIQAIDALCCIGSHSKLVLKPCIGSLVLPPQKKPQQRNNKPPLLSRNKLLSSIPLCHCCSIPRIKELPEEPCLRITKRTMMLRLPLGDPTVKQRRKQPSRHHPPTRKLPTKPSPRSVHSQKHLPTQCSSKKQSLLKPPPNTTAANTLDIAHPTNGHGQPTPNSRPPIDSISIVASPNVATNTAAATTNHTAPVPRFSGRGGTVCRTSGGHGWFPRLPRVVRCSCQSGRSMGRSKRRSKGR